MAPLFLALAFQAAPAPMTMIGDPAIFTPPSAATASGGSSAASAAPGEAGRRLSPRAQDSLSGRYSIDPRDAIEATQDAFNHR